MTALYPVGRLSAAVRSEIIPETDARRHGLTRPWFTQIQLDRGRTRLANMLLHEGVLYVQTSQAVIHALDAETGATLWAGQIGRPERPMMQLAANQDHLAVVNASRLYVCNRFDGNLLLEVRLDGAPGAGAALSEQRAYVPMINGLVFAYRVKAATDSTDKSVGKGENSAEGQTDGVEAESGKSSTTLAEEEIAADRQREDDEQTRRDNLRLQQRRIAPLACQSFGRALVQPLVTRQTVAEEYVVWPTDRGYLNIGWIDRRSEDDFGVKYRIETGEGITSRPAYLPPDANVETDSGIIFGASRDGFVHAVREKDGEPLWRFSTGEPILEPVASIGESIYVTVQLGGMYCLDAKAGTETWFAPRIKRFIAASNERVYAADMLGRILILHAKTGARLDTMLDTMSANAMFLKLMNSQTDRLYLASDTGLIQCLHELELAQPILHVRAPAKTPEAAKPAAKEPKGAEQPAGQEEPVGAGDPFRDQDAGGDSSGGGGDPFH
ncbi:MAG: hypothetical protein A2V70_03255 [Planctomycetes bacterium RBG_13_63_9]|nr:MAG: hypothetical protein A2V70_03255 [Planctomycetes bacterium RBG_13_63_9]